MKIWSTPITKPLTRPVQINFRATADLNEWLERYAANVGTSKGDLVYQLITYIKSQETP